MSVGSAILYIAKIGLFTPALPQNCLFYNFMPKYILTDKDILLYFCNLTPRQNEIRYRHSNAFRISYLSLHCPMNADKVLKDKNTGFGWLNFYIQHMNLSKEKKEQLLMKIDTINIVFAFTKDYYTSTLSAKVRQSQVVEIFIGGRDKALHWWSAFLNVELTKMHLDNTLSSQVHSKKKTKIKKI